MIWNQAAMLLSKMEADAASAVDAVDHGVGVTARCALETDQGSPTQREGATAVRVRDALLAVQRGDAFLDSARCVYSVCDAELFTPWPPGSRTAEMQFALSSRAALNSKFVEDGTGYGIKFRAILRTVKLAGSDMPPVGAHVRAVKNIARRVGATGVLDAGVGVFGVNGRNACPVHMEYGRTADA